MDKLEGMILILVMITVYFQQLLVPLLRGALLGKILAKERHLSFRSERQTVGFLALTPMTKAWRVGLGSQPSKKMERAHLLGDLTYFKAPDFYFKCQISSKHKSPSFSLSSFPNQQLFVLSLPYGHCRLMFRAVLRKGSPFFLTHTFWVA